MSNKFQEFIEQIKAKFQKGKDAAVDTATSTDIEMDDVANASKETEVKTSFVDKIKEKIQALTKKKLDEDKTQNDISTDDKTNSAIVEKSGTIDAISEDDIEEKTDEFNVDGTEASFGVDENDDGEDKTAVGSIETDINKLDDDTEGDINASVLLQNQLASQAEDDETTDVEIEGGEEVIPEGGKKFSADSIKEKIKNMNNMQKIIVALIVIYVIAEVLVPNAPKPGEDKSPKVASKPKNSQGRKKIQEKKSKTKEKKPKKTVAQKKTEAPKKSETTKEAPPKVTFKEEPPAPIVKAQPVEKIEVANPEPIKMNRPTPEEEIDNIPTVGEDSQKLEKIKNEDQNSKKAIDKIIEQQKQLVKDQKVMEEDYQPMPDYEIYGRGLVYNCKGKHWACVNRQAYFQCKRNERWNYVRQNQPECITKDVYASSDDCRTIQVYNINTSVKTEFCREQ